MRLLVFLLILGFCTNLHAQLLPDNKSLNEQSLQRWMNSAVDMGGVIEIIESMHVSDENLRQFDELPDTEQDRRIREFLVKTNQWINAEQIAKKYGWKSPGEFRRFSTKLGNAIAAYFTKQDQKGLNDDQRIQLREKLDPVILAVPEADIYFIEQHEKQLKAYIQSYNK